MATANKWGSKGTKIYTKYASKIQRILVELLVDDLYNIVNSLKKISFWCVQWFTGPGPRRTGVKFGAKSGTGLLDYRVRYRTIGTVYNWAEEKRLIWFHLLLC